MLLLQHVRLLHMNMTVILKNALHQKGLSRQSQVIIALGFTARAATVAEIRAIVANAGVRAARKWNISSVLGSLSGIAVRTNEGWELTDTGRTEFERLSGTKSTPPAAHSLRNVLSGLGSPDVRRFVEEAISCLEGKQFRAAVVLSWVGALALLYDHVRANVLPAFNAEAVRRDAKWKAAGSSDDLARMKEYDFLQVLESISVIGKNVKVELEAALKLRNGCGHPNSLVIADHRVASHVETLALNVFAPFS